MVTWRDVDSTTVKRVGWDRDGNMFIEFLDGDIYGYPNVTRQQAVAVANAVSVGRYVNLVVKKKYKGYKL